MGENETFNIQGFVSPGWETVRSVFKQNFIDGLDIGASCSVYHQGQCVVDLSGGWKDLQMTDEPYSPETLQLVFSVSKGVMAAAIALCADRGLLDFDAPVVQYWPEFGVNGKENIKVSDLLSHRAGLPYVDESLKLDDVCDWTRMTTLLANQKPHWPPGTGHGYHAVTNGFLAGELVRRLDPQHRSYGQFLRDELDEGFYVGVTTDAVESRVAPLIRKIPPNPVAPPAMNLMTQKTMSCSDAFPSEPPTSTNLLFNRTELHRAEIPAANGITNARSLARIYALLLGDVHENNQTKKRLISEKTLLEATKSVTPAGEPDQVLFGIPSNFTKAGFQGYGEYFKALGPAVFGHKGMGGSCALAYPPQQVTFAHVCNQLDFTVPTLDPRTVRLLQAVEEVLAPPSKSKASWTCTCL